MENEITIQKNVVYKTDKGTPVTDSLKVAEVFGKEHRNIIRAIRNILGVGSNLSAPKWFYESTYIDAQGKPRPMFIMNRDGFSLLAMGLTGAKAMQFKVGFIEQFNAMETVVKQIQEQPSTTIPQSFAEALRLAAVQAEEIERQQKQIEENTPKVQYFDKCIERNGSTNFRDTAKLLGYQQTVFINCLLMFGYIYRDNKHRLRPYAEYVDKGYFEVKEYASESSSGIQTLITAKGREYFSQRDFSI